MVWNTHLKCPGAGINNESLLWSVRSLYDLWTRQRRDERRFWSLRLFEEMASVIIHSQLRDHNGRQCCHLSDICCIFPGLIYYALHHLNPPDFSSLAVMNFIFFPPETVDHCPSHRVANKSHKFQDQKWQTSVQAELGKKNSGVKWPWVHNIFVFVNLHSITTYLQATGIKE